MGLPGAGKTFMAQAMKSRLEKQGYTVSWFNADLIRQQFDDWDFSLPGRLRQSRRMRELADASLADYAICDFVAPLEEMRENFLPDWLIWMDTIDSGRFEDTNAMFRPPLQYDFRVCEQDADHWSEFIVDQHIIPGTRRPRFDWRRETVQMLGRWQPWHAGHRALFERLIQRTGQVIIQIRDVQGWQGSNPFSFEQAAGFIRRDLDPLYQGQYEIQLVPNIVHIGWGRGVGYTSGEETFDDSITQISATQIRREMGLE